MTDPRSSSSRIRNPPNAWAHPVSLGRNAPHKAGTIPTCLPICRTDPQPVFPSRTNREQCPALNRTVQNDHRRPILAPTSVSNTSCGRVVSPKSHCIHQSKAKCLPYAGSNRCLTGRLRKPTKAIPIQFHREHCWIVFPRIKPFQLERIIIGSIEPPNRGDSRFESVSRTKRLASALKSEFAQRGTQNVAPVSAADSQ